MSKGRLWTGEDAPPSDEKRARVKQVPAGELHYGAALAEAEANEAEWRRAEAQRQARISAGTRSEQAKRRRLFLKKLLAETKREREPSASELARRLTMAGYKCSKSTVLGDLSAIRSEKRPGS